MDLATMRPRAGGYGDGGHCWKPRMLADVDGEKAKPAAARAS